MAITKFVVPALAIVSTVAAASCSTSATTTIVNPAGASALAACSTFSGSVLLATGVAQSNTVNLDGLQEITGTLSYQDDNNVQTIQAGQLTSTGDLQLGNLTQLSGLALSALNSVGNLNMTSLSSLQSLNFGQTGITKAISILITNTQLSTLTGISNLEQVDSVNINNNPFLAQIELMITSLKKTLDIGANDVSGNGLSVSFPKLETCDGEMTIRNATNISLPSLANVSQNLGFYGNDITMLATPNLTFAGGIVVVDNVKLTNISMPLLTTINGTNGTYQIANNTQLKTIDGFGDLSNVKGSLDFSGNFSTVKLPKLSNVGGALNIQTSAQFDCGPINDLGQVVKGKTTCAGQQTKPGSIGSNPTGTGASSSPSSTSTAKSAAGHFDVNVPFVMGGISLFAGLLQLLL